MTRKNTLVHRYGKHGSQPWKETDSLWDATFSIQLVIYFACDSRCAIACLRTRGQPIGRSINYMSDCVGHWRLVEEQTNAKYFEKTLTRHAVERRKSAENRTFTNTAISVCTHVHSSQQSCRRCAFISDEPTTSYARDVKERCSGDLVR